MISSENNPYSKKAELILDNLGLFHDPRVILKSIFQIFLFVSSLADRAEAKRGHELT